eukprot:2785915-Karenia_brevis.AAC.1
MMKAFSKLRDLSSSHKSYYNIWVRQMSWALKPLVAASGTAIHPIVDPVTPGSGVGTGSQENGGK